MTKLAKFAFLDGKVIPTANAKIHVFDLGIMRGMAVFDFLKFINFKPIFLKEHIDRLFNSAKIFNIPTIYNKDEYVQIIENLIAKNKQKNGSIRIIISAGPITSGFTITQPHIIILIEPYYEMPEVYFKKGVKIITLQHRRNFAEAKHTNYAIAGINDYTKVKAHATEILYVDDKGFVTEPSTSNICMIKKGILYTPKSNILDGVTLKHVLKCAQKLKIKCVAKDFKLNELLAADEVFITATNKDVLPVVKIDSNKVGNGKVGEITKNLLEEYRKEYLS